MAGASLNFKQYAVMPPTPAERAKQGSYSMRLKDQPAVLEWFPTEIKTVRRYQPLRITPQRMNFETVAAAVAYATSTLPEGFRRNATIKTRDVTLHWGDIERWGKPQ
jgi:hypothetical protein